MIRNIVIIWSIALDVRRGGVHRIIKMLLEQLPQRGFNVKYVYTNDRYKTFIANSDGEEINIPSDCMPGYLRSSGCDLIIGQDGVFSNALSSLVKSWDIPDVVYITQYHNSIAILEKVFTREYWSMKMDRAMTLKDKMSSCFQWLLHPILHYRTRKAEIRNFNVNYNVADRIIFLSENEISLAEKFIGKKLSKCVAINNPLTLNYSIDESILDKKKKEVLIVSRLYNPEKRIDKALRIWQIVEMKGMEDWRLRIVGDGVDKQSLIDLSNSLGLRRVSFEGKQYPEPYYESASIFMMTSAVEGWGLTLTESMQTGVVPMAFNSYPALTDIITDGYDGLIIPNNDIDAYADKLINLMRDKDNRERMALNGLTSCRRFEMDKIVDQWVNMIESL